MALALLSETQVRNAKPTEKVYKLNDGGGLCLLVTPAGARLWRLRYRQPGKARVVEGGKHDGKNRGRPESMISLGKYPDISLEDAREDASKYRRLFVRERITPADAKRAEDAKANDTFRDVAVEWLKIQNFKPKTLEKTEWTFKKLLFPHIGSKSVATLERPEILRVLRQIEARGKHETAHRTGNRIGQVLRFAIGEGKRTAPDPTHKISEQLKSFKVVNHASIKEAVGIGELLRAIDGYNGDPATKAALKIAPFLFARPGELRAAEWSEFDLDGKEPTWTIPGPRMKMGLEHIVPLAPAAVDILRAIHPLTGRGRYVFPSVRTASRPMSDNTLNAALRRLGYTSEQMTAHGFRSMASTRLNEAKKNGKRMWDADWIERQLAHVEGNKVRGAYNAAEYIEGRRKMMLWWAKYLDELKAAK